MNFINSEILEIKIKTMKSRKIRWAGRVKHKTLRRPECKVLFRQYGWKRKQIYTCKGK